MSFVPHGALVEVFCKLYTTIKLVSRVWIGHTYKLFTCTYQGWMPIIAYPDDQLGGLVTLAAQQDIADRTSRLVDQPSSLERLDCRWDIWKHNDTVLLD